jgi:DNA-binding NtrC family response regulator
MRVDALTPLLRGLGHEVVAVATVAAVQAALRSQSVVAAIVDMALPVSDVAGVCVRLLSLTQAPVLTIYHGEAQRAVAVQLMRQGIADTFPADENLELAVARVENAIRRHMPRE